MSVALGKFFVALLIFQTLMIVLPYGSYNAGSSAGQYKPQTQNQILGMKPKRWTELQIAASNVVYAAAIVVPILIVGESKTSPVGRFVTGFSLWLVSKAWQSYKNGIVHPLVNGTPKSLYRVFDMYQVVVENTSWGIMASAFVP
jgi:hypothetical protein